MPLQRPCAPPKALSKILAENKLKSVVFCSSIEEVKRMSALLHSRGFAEYAPLHSELKSFQRNSAIKRFSSGKIRVLIATDLAARGVHFKNARRVYSLGVSQKFYLHRAGRTGRMHESGECVSIVLAAEVPALIRVFSSLGIVG
ncbi:C-terminal helicase domain-containing protein [Candidatus Micrarchaeota archaeon]|nr:C-terminal helicase domain-containing protein [Candidatus Micrarchaeota archaeon]